MTTTTQTKKQIKKPNLHFKNFKVSQCNKKLQPTEKVNFLIWNLLAKVTCPHATELCKKSCYAFKSERMYKDTYKRNKYNTIASVKNTFVTDMIEFVKIELSKAKKQGKHIYYRIHESGDFYNYVYLNKWITIANYFKGENITFQAYTKSLPFIDRYLNENKCKLSDININFIFSVWNDTPSNYVKLSSKLYMKTYEAFTSDVLEQKINNEGYVKCDCIHCGECGRCYDGLHNKIAVKIH